MADDRLLEIRIRLQGARQAAADAQIVNASMREVAASTRSAGEASVFANAKSFLWRQGLYTLRRSLFGVSVAAAGLAAAGLKMGFGFNSGMEQAQISFTQFLGSAKAARQELGFLFNLAARTPFDTQNVREAAQSFLAMGFNVKETNRLLGILGDTAAGLGLGGSGVSRLAIIFGQIRASGRLLGGDVLQLAQAGINARGIIQQQLHLSQTQMTKFMQGQLSIPSNIALEAITRGLQQRFGGLAAKQSGTFQGLTSTVHDFFGQFTGTLTLPLFKRTEAFLSNVTKILPGLNTTLQTRGFNAMVAALDKSVGAGGRLTHAWSMLSGMAAHLLQIVARGVIPAFRSVGDTIRTLTGGNTPLRLATGLLGTMARNASLVRLAIELLIVRMVYVRTVGVVSMIAGLVRLQAQLILVGGETSALYRSLGKLGRIGAITVAIDLIANPPKGASRYSGRSVGAKQAWANFYNDFMKRPAVALVGFFRRDWQNIASLLGQPFGQAAGGIRRGWDDTIAFFRSLPSRMRSAAGDLFGWIRDGFRTALNWIIDRWNGLHFKLPSATILGHHIGGWTIGLGHIPPLAAGGTILRAGTALVGERGPELVSLPRAATVAPLASAGHPGALAGLAQAIAAAVRDNLTVVGEFQVDGETLSRSVARHPRPLAAAIARQVDFGAARS